MHFAAPYLLVFALAGPVLMWGLHRHAQRARAEALARLGTPEVVGRLVRGAGATGGLRAVMLGVAFVLLGVAAAGPRLPGAPREVEARGLDLVIALDVSQSMLAEDVAPSRLARARAELKALLGQLPGDRVGLVLFAGDAFIQSPLTTDHAAIRLFLDAAAPEMMPTQGTDFETAVSAALDTFGEPPSAAPGAPPPAARVLLIVSDGERHTGDTARLAAQAEQAGVLVLAAGVGEPGGATIPVFENGRRVGDKRDPDTGQPVYTRLDPAALRALAAEGGYFHIGRAGSDLGALPRRLDGLSRATVAVADEASFRELYAYPLALALLLLALEPLLARGRRRGARMERPPTGVSAASAPARPSPPVHA